MDWYGVAGIMFVIGFAAALAFLVFWFEKEDDDDETKHDER